MNLLFVLSQIELTGAETYAMSLVDRLKKRGHKIVFVSDTLNSQKKDISYYSLDLNNRKSFINRYRHVRSICQIVKREKINLIHAHSRASSWVAYFASRLTNTPLVTTAHCIYPVHLSRKLLPCFGKKVIAICGSVKDHLIKDLGINSEDILLIPNGVDMGNFRLNVVTSDKIREELGIQDNMEVISWIGRFSGPRGMLIEKMIEKVFPDVIRTISKIKFLIVAGGRRSSFLEENVKTLNNKFNREVVKFTGLRNDIPEICSLSNLVIGAGRVSMEALACGRPVIAIGENKFVGLVNPKTIEEGVYNNFGDCCLRESVDWNKLSSLIVDILSNKEKAKELGKWGREVAMAQFDLEKVAQEVEKVYKEILNGE